MQLLLNETLLISVEVGFGPGDHAVRKLYLSIATSRSWSITMMSKLQPADQTRLPERFYSARDKIPNVTYEKKNEGK